jgi:peroxiredoxin
MLCNKLANSPSNSSDINKSIKVEGKLVKVKFSVFGIMLLLSMTSFAQEPTPRAGQKAPDFEIIQMDGTTFKLSDYRGKQAVYLVFWNTWCGYCMKKTPKLKQTQVNLADKIKIIAINTSLKDSLEKSLAFQQQFEINYSLAFDHGKIITDRYGVWGTPTEFIIDINGIIQYRDGVPDDLQPLLSQWNTPRTLTENQQGCAETNATC